MRARRGALRRTDFRAGPASCLTDWLMPLAERRASGAPVGVLERLRSNRGGCASALRLEASALRLEGFQNSDSCPEMSRFPGEPEFWHSTSSVHVCTRLTGGLIRPGIKEIEKVSHGWRLFREAPRRAAERAAAPRATAAARSTAAPAAIDRQCSLTLSLLRRNHGHARRLRLDCVPTVRVSYAAERIASPLSVGGA
jgi:hypothetical protein